MVAASFSALPSAGTSVVVIGVLSLLFTVSIAMFWMLSERSTSRRQRVAFGEWAREEGFRLRFDLPEPPEPFDMLHRDGLGVRIALVDRKRIVWLVQMGNWNVLVHKIDADWKPTGLRPAAAEQSVLDLFSLASFPLMGPSERFVLFSVDPEPARSLSSSSARALLPPDVGLLLHGHWLVLDFSSRPFDVVELNRMRAVAEQVTGHLAAR